MARETLNAGFTGDVTEDSGVVVKAKTVALQARDEASLVAAHAVDHPAATGSAVAIVGMAGLAIGYLLGVSAASRNRRRYF